MRHCVILSNFTHDGTSICSGFLTPGHPAIEHGFDGFLHIKPGCRPVAERDIIHSTPIAQNSLPVDYEGVGSRDRFISICYDMLRIQQDPWDSPRFSDIFQNLSGFISIRRNGQQFHVRAPLNETCHHRAVGPLRMWAFRRPEIDNHNFAAMTAQFLNVAFQIRKCKIGRGSVDLHGIIIT